MSDLFAPLDPREPGFSTFIGGEEETPDRLAASFLLAGDALVVACGKAGRSVREDLALPILQTYRHAIELFLKANCLDTVNSVARGSKIGIGHDTVPTDFNERLKTHSIAKLVNLLNLLVSGLADDSGTGKVPEDIAKTLSSLHQLDNDGLAFRYTTQWVDGKWVPIRPTPVKLNIIGAVSRLRDAAEILRFGYAGWLRSYDEYLSDMEADYAMEMRDAY